MHDCINITLLFTQTYFESYIATILLYVQEKKSSSAIISTLSTIYIHSKKKNRNNNHKKWMKEETQRDIRPKKAHRQDLVTLV